MDIKKLFLQTTNCFQSAQHTYDKSNLETCIKNIETIMTQISILDYLMIGKKLAFPKKRSLYLFPYHG